MSVRTARELHPLSCFYLDSDPRIAAAHLTRKHLLSQCYALGQCWTQIARQAGVDLTDHPRSRGAYPPAPLTLAGVWAMTSSANWAWFGAYSTWVLQAYADRYGRQHTSRDYVTWCRREIAAAGAWVTEGPLTVPPVRGVAAGLLRDEAAVIRAARRVYEGLPPFESPTERALWVLSAEIGRNAREWSDERRTWLLEHPHLAYAREPNDPVIRAVAEAVEAGATPAELAQHLLVAGRRAA